MTDINSQPRKTDRPNAIPFSIWHPIIAGVVAGLLLRLVFSGVGGGSWSAMAGAFIYLSPIVVGAITVYVAETKRRRNWGYYIAAPFFANCLYVLGTLAVNIEGLICAIVVVPMFALLGSLGGLLMGVVCRTTQWPKQTLYCLAALPVLLGVAGDQIPTPDVQSSVRRSTVVHATPEQVWGHINNATQIQPEEFSASWAAKIGVPMPLSGVTHTVTEGGGGATTTRRVRESQWNKGVHFDEPITDWVPNRYVRWTYKFDDTSFPAGALDDHVLIGGHYFDLHDTSFTLTPVPEGTRLDVLVHYRVSTQFNFYADRVAQLLLGNMMDTDLLFYKVRSERGLAHTE